MTIKLSSKQQKWKNEEEKKFVKLCFNETIFDSVLSVSQQNDVKAPPLSLSVCPKSLANFIQEQIKLYTTQTFENYRK